MLIAFISGGLIGSLGQVLTNIFLNYFNFTISDSYLLTFTFFIVVGSILTGSGVFDKVLSICKCGLIVPSTGFANTMTSSAMDTRSEGFIKGIGAVYYAELRSKDRPQTAFQAADTLCRRCCVQRRSISA